MQSLEQGRNTAATLAKCLGLIASERGCNLKEWKTHLQAVVWVLTRQSGCHHCSGQTALTRAFVKAALAAQSSKGRCLLNTQLTWLKIRLLKKYLFSWALRFLLNLQTIEGVPHHSCPWRHRDLGQVLSLLGCPQWGSGLYFEGPCVCARVRFRGGRHRPSWDYSQGIPNSRGLLEMQSLNSSPRNSNITDNYHLQILLLSYSTFNFICIHYANPYSYCAFYIKK